MTTNTQYLAVASAGSPSLRLFKSTDNATTWTLISNQPLVQPAVATTSGETVAWSPDKRMLVIAHAVAPYVSTYAFDDVTESLTLQTGTSVAIPTATSAVQTVAWSPDGTLFAMGFSSFPHVRFYQRNSRYLNSVTSLPLPQINPGSAVTEIVFKPATLAADGYNLTREVVINQGIWSLTRTVNSSGFGVSAVNNEGNLPGTHNIVAYNPLYPEIRVTATGYDSEFNSTGTWYARCSEWDSDTGNSVYVHQYIDGVPVNGINGETALPGFSSQLGLTNGQPLTVEFQPSDPNRLYIGTAANTVEVYRYNGSTWQHLTDVGAVSGGDITGISAAKSIVNGSVSRYVENIYLPPGYVQEGTIAANFAVTATLTPAVIPIEAASDLTVQTSVTALAGYRQIAQAAINSEFNVQATAEEILSGIVLTSSLGSMTVSGTNVRLASADISTEFALSATGTRGQTATAELSTAATFTAQATGVKLGSATLATQATVTAVAGIVYSIGADLNSSAELTATANKTADASADINVSTAVTTVATGVALAAATMNITAQVSAAGGRIRPISADLTSVTNQTSSAERIFDPVITTDSEVTIINAVADIFCFASADLISVFSMTGDAIDLDLASADIASESSVTVTAVVTRDALVDLVSTSTVTIDARITIIQDAAAALTSEFSGNFQGNAIYDVVAPGVDPEYTWDSQEIWDPWEHAFWGPSGPLISVKTSLTAEGGFITGGSADLLTQSTVSAVGRMIFDETANLIATAEVSATGGYQFSITETLTAQANCDITGTRVPLGTADITSTASVLTQAALTLEVIPPELDVVTEVNTLQNTGTVFGVIKSAEPIDFATDTTLDSAGVLTFNPSINLTGFFTEVAVLNIKPSDPYRTFSVENDGRVLMVRPENRIYTIPSETRILRVLGTPDTELARIPA